MKTFSPEEWENDPSKDKAPEDAMPASSITPTAQAYPTIATVPAEPTEIAEIPAISDELTEEIQNAPNGNMDIWINGYEDNAQEESVSAPEEIQMSKNPNIQLGRFEAKWIFDEEELPHFPSFVFDLLPPFLKEVVGNCISEDDRDMILMGAITCLSATLHNVVGKYDKDYWGPMLYFFVMADAGMGKGSLNYCRQLVASIHKELRETSEQQIREYRAERKQAKEDGVALSGDEPHRRSLFIPTNSSASAIIEQLDYNNGIGLIFDTECDTLTAALKS